MKTWTVEEAIKNPPTGPEVTELYDQIAKLLAGRHPALQGAVIADLTATWLAGHPEKVLSTLLEDHMRLVWDLVPVNRAAAEKAAKSVC